MRKFTLIILILLIPEVIHAQITFKRSYYKNLASEGFAVQQTIDGGYIAVGSTRLDNTFIPFDILVIKTDSMGNTMWIKSFDHSVPQTKDVGRSVIQLPGGDYLVTGYIWGWLGLDALIMKLDANGNLIWSKSYEAGVQRNEMFYCIQPTSDGNYIAVGNAEFTWSSGMGLYMVKIDANGNKLWSKVYDTFHSYESGIAISQTSDGGFIIASRFGARIYKVDALGNNLWEKDYDTYVSAIWGRDVLQMDDGNYLLAANQGLIKLNPVGDTLWVRKPGSYAIHDIEKTSDGGYVFTGSGGLLFKTDGQLNILWAKYVGESNNSVHQTSDGGFILTGSNFVSGMQTLHLIKTDSMGNTNCNDSSIAFTWLNPSLLNISTRNAIEVSGASVFNESLTLSNGGFDTLICVHYTPPEPEPEPPDSTTDSTQTVVNSFFNVYPVPVSEILSLQFETLIENGYAKIFNVLGELVYYDLLYKELKKEINISNFSSGIYFVKVSDGEKSYCKKFIVAHN